VGAFFNAFLLLKKLLKQKAYQPAAGWALFIIRVVLASAAMSAVLYYCVDADWWQRWGSADRVMNLLAWIALGGAMYVLTLILTGLRPKHLLSKV
jgi:putative peptidoglycan lipid II flippase